METALTVLLLARDEADNLRNLVPRVSRALQETTEGNEILVVDGHSDDQTASVAASLGARVVMQSEAGYAAAFREGIWEARGAFVCNLDGDGSHDPSYVPRMFTHCRDADLVIGSRYCNGGHYDGQLFRRCLSRLLNVFCRCVVRCPYHDLSSGFRCFRRDVLLSMPMVAMDFDVHFEVCVRLWKAGGRIVEFPIRYSPRSEGVSKASFIRFAKSYVRTLRNLRR